MKQVFQIEIDSPDTLEKEGSKVQSDDIKYYLFEGIKGDFRPWCAEKFKVSVVEQTCGTPENTSENSKKPLRLSGNIAPENKIEDNDDYLDDRMNSLIDREGKQTKQTRKLG